MLVVLGDKKVLRLVDWLNNVETPNNSCKTLHTHMAKMKRCGFIKKKVVECIVKTSVEKATLIPCTRVTHGMDDSNKIGHIRMVQS